MSARNLILDLDAALNARERPTVLRWNRLEGRPRNEDFRRALRAEVRDAMWMLCRQWQFGEFEGDDAGSPISARLRLRQAPLTDYSAAGEATEPLHADTPLEPRVEPLPIALTSGAQPMALDIRLALGRRWLALLAAQPALASYRAVYRNAYRVDAPDLSTRQAGLVEAHQAAAQAFAGAAGRCMDGGKLLLHLAGGGAASDGITLVAPADAAALDQLGTDLRAWYARVFSQPAGNDAWRAPRLEYAFDVDAAARPGAAHFQAPEHRGGRIDWHSFDSAPGSAPSLPPPADQPATLIPTPLQFDGMPNTRWWRFEDGRVNFGDIRPDRVDLGRLLLIEFGLVYGNDWYLIPVQTPVGSVSDVRALVVTDTFGDNLWVEPAGAGADHGWRGWRMFGLSAAGGGSSTADTGLLLPPNGVGVLDGAPLEEVLLARDETSNLVWGIERLVTLPSGDSRAGGEAAAEMLAYQQRWSTLRPPVQWAAPLRYELMTTVPEHWIPFTPAQVAGQAGAVRLQRATMLRAIDADPPESPVKVRPRTSLLRPGLDQSPRQPYFLFEEEVPRAGARVIKAFRRTRGPDGAVHTWLAARKRTGRGESGSGLAFDSIKATG